MRECDGFWDRFLLENPETLVVLLRSVADAIEDQIMGPPMFGVVIFEGSSMGQIEVPDSSGPLTGTVTFLDAKGGETAPDTLPVWASDNEEAATVAAADDGLTAVVTIGLPGAAIISVETTETNTGETISAQGTVTVLPGDTTTGSVEFAAQ